MPRGKKFTAEQIIGKLLSPAKRRRAVEYVLKNRKAPERCAVACHCGGNGYPEQGIAPPQR